MMLVIGVRSSWLTVERKSFLVSSSWARRSVSCFSWASASSIDLLVAPALGDVVGDGEVAGGLALLVVAPAERDRDRPQLAVGPLQVPVPGDVAEVVAQERLDQGAQRGPVGLASDVEGDQLSALVVAGDPDDGPPDDLRAPCGR